MIVKLFRFCRLRMICGTMTVNLQSVTFGWLIRLQNAFVPYAESRSTTIDGQHPGKDDEWLTISLRNDDLAAV